MNDGQFSHTRKQGWLHESEGATDPPESDRDTAEAAYRGGIISLTDVLDADRLLLVAQDELAKTRADAARAAVASFRALGGGWSGSAGVAVATARGHA